MAHLRLPAIRTTLLRVSMSMPSTPYQLAKATAAELDILVHQRYRMFAEMGHGDPDIQEAGRPLYTQWLQERLLNGRYHAWLMHTTSGEAVAGVGLYLLDWPTGVVDLAPYRGYVFNVWTEPEHRRKGLSRQLMEALLAACPELGVQRVGLHATAEGRALYEVLGFEPSNEMMITVRKG